MMTTIIILTISLLVMLVIIGTICGIISRIISGLGAGFVSVALKASRTSNLIFDQIGDYSDEPDNTSRSAANGKIHKKYRKIHKAFKIACFIELMKLDEGSHSMEAAMENDPEYDQKDPLNRIINTNYYNVDPMGFYYKDMVSGNRIKFFWIITRLRLRFFFTKSRWAMWVIYPALVSLMAGYVGNVFYNGKFHEWCNGGFLSILTTC